MLVYRSGLVTREATKEIELNIAGVDKLTLYVGDGGDHAYNDRADWADARVTCAG